ncbi:MAG: 3-hydroxy-3-methylglutaryl-CoA reductase, partial [Mesorhizobium sp.]
GIMNGIDPIVVATGNDWRAIEAGAHAWAARGGRYTSLSRWEIDAAGNLVGTLEMPMALGMVGGATKTHPAARAALKLLGVTTAQELAEVTVAVGLAQNMAALRALATEGIQRGHMALHAR